MSQNGAKETLGEFFQLISDGRIEEMEGMLSPDLIVDSSHFGRFTGVSGFREFCTALKNWLESGKASIDTFSVVDGGNSIVVESTLFIEVDGKTTDLPVAMASDLNSDGIGMLRVYFSTWPLTGRHENRPPILREDQSVVLPASVEKYMEALAGSDPKKVSSLFADDGYVREPSGSAYVYIGRKRIMEFYRKAVSGGGIPLHHCSCISDGTSTAVEYYFDSWNGTSFPPEAGIAVYVTGEDGSILAARIYDDAAPPDL